MQTTHDKTEEERHLYDLIEDFKFGMFVTIASDSTIKSRPLSIERVDGSNLLYFPTNLNSAKIGELANDARAHVTMQDDRVFVSLSGSATVTTDRALIDRLWKDTWKVWFPDGKSDPSICIIEFAPETGEYWDNDGIQGLKYLFKSAKAWATGTRPSSDEDENARVDLSAER